MNWIEVSSQAELDKAIEADPKAFVIVRGSGVFRAFGSATVDAFDSATVHAFDSATVRAFGSATVRAYDSATVRASKYVAIHKRHQAEVTGGVIIEVPSLDTAEQWLDYYGIEIKDGIAVLFKAVNDDYVSGRGFRYEPGTTPEEAEGRWDPSPEINCGAGLHFCPRPHIAHGYNGGATRYVACPVAVDEIVIYRHEDQPTKVRAPRVAGPIFEVDVDGEPIKAAI